MCFCTTVCCGCENDWNDGAGAGPTNEDVGAANDGAAENDGAGPLEKPKFNQY